MYTRPTIQTNPTIPLIHPPKGEESRESRESRVPIQKKTKPEPLNPNRQKVEALLGGPTPRRLILNRFHDRKLRSQVAELSKALPKLERMARSGNRKAIVHLRNLRTYQQGFEALAIDGLFKHEQTHPETKERLHLWQCVMDNSERLRRLRKAVNEPLIFGGAGGLGSFRECLFPGYSHPDPRRAQPLFQNPAEHHHRKNK
jgi:hypothetical protein